MKKRLQEVIQIAEKATKPATHGLVAVAAGASGLGIWELLPYDLPARDAMAAAVGGAIFGSLEIIIYYLREVTPELVKERPNKLAIASILASSALIFSVSTSSTTVALCGDEARRIDAQEVYVTAQDSMYEATAAVKAVSGLSQTLTVMAQDADMAAEQEVTGESINGLPSGKGPVYKRHLAYARDLNSLVEVIERNADQAEGLIQRMESPLRKMRVSLDTADTTLELIARFEPAHREWATDLIQMREMDLADQVERMLAEMVRSSIKASYRDKDTLQALRDLDAEINRDVAGISEHIQTKLVKIKPVDVYNAPTPVQATFRHLGAFWVQFCVALIFDAAILLTVLMRIAVVRETHREETEEDPKDRQISERQLTVIAQLLKDILGLQKNDKDDDGDSR